MAFKLFLKKNVRTLNPCPHLGEDALAPPYYKSFTDFCLDYYIFKKEEKNICDKEDSNTGHSIGQKCILLLEHYSFHTCRAKKLDSLVRIVQSVTPCPTLKAYEGERPGSST